MALAKRKSNIENDWLDCIIALPKDLFYNTGINTYIWFLNNNKPKAVITNFGESILNDSRFSQLKAYDVSVNVNADTDGGQPTPFQ